MTRRLCTALLCLLALPCLVLAQNRDVVITANDVPENPDTAFQISVDVDRPSRRYKPGDPLTLQIRSQSACYATIFDVGTSGNVTVLLPNRYRSDNRIRAGTQVSFPSASDGFRYVVSPPVGTERIVVVGTSQRLDLTPADLVNYENSRSVFMTAPAGSGRVLMARVRDVLVESASSEWASDQVTFQIGTEPADGGGGQAQQVWAFVAAVADYPGNMHDLNYTDDDARLFTQVLQEHLKVPRSNIRMVLDGEVTRDGFCEGLDWLAEKVGRNDVAYIFFSGHGTHGPDDNGDEEDGQDEFLCLYDGNLRDDDYGQSVSRIKCDRIIEITDTCFSGGSARNIKSIAPTTRSALVHLTDGFGPMEWGLASREVVPEGVCLIAASQPDQTSQESSNLSQGVFTHFLAEGLTGDADADGDGKVTVRELYQYTHENVRAYTSGAQEPFLLPANSDFSLTP